MKKTNIAKILNQDLSNFFKYSTFDEDWKNLLSKINSLHKYSSNNLLLMFAQNKYFTYAASKQKWKELGRNVNHDAKGMWIYVPYKKKYLRKDNNGEDITIIKTYFFQKKTFDVSETSGDIDFILTKKLIDDNLMAVEIINHIEQLCNFPIINQKLDKGQESYFDSKNKIIILNRLDSSSQRLKSLLYFLAIAENKRETQDLKIKKIEAESVAYVLMNNIGINSSDYSFPFIYDLSNGNLNLVKNTFQQIELITNKLIKKYALEAYYNI